MMHGVLGFIESVHNMPIPWYWLLFTGAMVSTIGILIYRKNTKVYKD